MSAAQTQFCWELANGLADMKPDATVDDLDAIWEGMIAKYPDVWATNLESLKAEWYFNRKYTLPYLNLRHRA